MKVTHLFSDKAYEVLTTPLDIKDVHTIEFKIIEGPFEHYYIVIKDPENEVRGLFTYKTRCKAFYITECFSTTSNGGISGVIQDGTWTVSIVRPGILEGGCSYEICLNSEAPQHAYTLDVLNQSFDTVINSVAQYYKGDFHAHSLYSDGRVTLQTIAQAADKQGLTFLSFTDHAVVPTRFVETEMLIIPSTEITPDDDGHYNVHGLKKLIDYTKYFDTVKTKEAALEALFSDLKQQGAILSINHPFAPTISLTHHYDIRHFDLLEIMNAPHLVDEYIDNEKAIRFLDFLWSKGHRLVGVSGSDAHKENFKDSYPIGVPTAHLYCPQLSIQNVLNSLKSGHLYATNQVEATIEMHCHDRIILPGECVEGTVEIVTKSSSVLTWELVVNGVVLASQEGKEATFNYSLTAHTFIRVQAKKNGLTVIFVNPVYSTLVTPQTYAFQTLLGQFEEEEAAS